MDIADTARLGSLLRATISDYIALHEKINQIMSLEKDLERATKDNYPEIAALYVRVVEEYLVTNSMLKIQYQALQRFAEAVKSQDRVKNTDISKARLELMLLDIEYTNTVPNLRTSIEKIHEVLLSSGAILDSTLAMVGVIKDGEIRV